MMLHGNASRRTEQTDKFNSGVLASVARLAYQAVYARRPNKTIIIIIVLLVKYAHDFTIMQTG